VLLDMGEEKRNADAYKAGIEKAKSFKLNIVPFLKWMKSHQN